MVGLLWGLTHWANGWEIPLVGSIALSGPGEVSSFSACVPGTLNPVLAHPFCLYLLTSQPDFVLLIL